MTELNKSLILSLLKAELKSTKLLNGLHDAGLIAEDFYLGISTEILKLIGFPDAENDDELHDFYFRGLESRCKKDLTDFLENLNSITLDFYNELLEERVKRLEVKIKE